MNGIVRHIVITHLSRFTIIFVIHSSSLHNITSTQPYLYDTFNIVSTTNCLILIYQLFLQLFNVFVTYIIHISVIPTFYGDLQVIMFVLLHLNCMYLCPSWRSIFSIAIQYVFLIQLSCLYKRNSIHVQQSSKFDIFNMYTSVHIVICTKQPKYLLHFVVYHYTIMWHTYILPERLLVHDTCTLTHDIIQRYKNECNYIDSIAFYCTHTMLSFYLLFVYRIHSEFHNIYIAIDYG